MGIEMKIATFVLSLLTVSGQTTDGSSLTSSDAARRKKWKTTEAATTTTITTTEADTTTLPEYPFGPNDSLDGEKDTKDTQQDTLQQLLQTHVQETKAPVKEPEAETVNTDGIVHVGHQFGDSLNLETKGPILADAPKGPDQQKGGKKKGKGPKGSKKDSSESGSDN